MAARTITPTSSLWNNVVHVVTDSTADITPKLAEVLGVTVVPLRVRFGSDEFRDGVDLDADGFFEKLAASKQTPTTSQPPPTDFSAVYQSLLTQPGDSVVSVHISSALSGTVQSATLAAQDFGERVQVVDSLSATAGLANLVRRAKRAADAGTDAAAIAQDLLAVRERQRFFGLIPTLEYLLRGGRINRAQAIVGGMLSVKPIVTINPQGEVVQVAKLRGQRAALEALLEMACSHGEIATATVMNAQAPELGDEVSHRIAERFPNAEIFPGIIGPVIGTYSGPGAVGVAFILA